MPHPNYAVFLDMLVDTVREKIAVCSQLAYETIPVRDAQKLLMLENEQKVGEFVQMHEWEIRTVGQEKILVLKSSKNESLDIPSWDVTEAALHYATELERIV